MIRVGIIGFGYATRTFHLPLIGTTPGLEVTTIASSRPADVARDHPALKVVDADALIADDAIDLIVVATPNDSHARWAIAALEAGKHVVVEKPFAIDLAEGRRVAEAAARTGRLLSVFHNRRWDSDFLSVRAAIEQGAIGRVVHFESHFDRFRPQVRERWREGAGPGAGIWYDLGPHLVDQAVALFGPPDAVTTRLATLRTDGVADDWAHAVLHYSDREVLLHASMLVAGGVPRFVVHGDRGSLAKAMADRQEAQLLAGMRPGAEGWGDDPDALQLWDETGTASLRPAQPGDQRDFYRGVATAIAGDGPNPVSPEDALAVMAIIDAGRLSSRDGRRVTPDFGR